MRASRILPVAVLISSVLTACIRVGPATLGHVPDARGDTSRVATGSTPATVSFLEKTVTRKDSPATRVANDFTNCKVGSEEFASVKVDDPYRCSWQK